MTRERMVAAAEEMTNWARRELDKEKSFVVGHSWGSYLGLEVAKRHPDWMRAYIGVGQLTDGLRANAAVGHSLWMPPAARET